eukprot:gene4981-9954_t
MNSNSFTSLFTDRKSKIVKELLTTFKSMTEVRNTKDETILEIMFFESNRKACTLRIFLDKDFPTSKPVLQVVGSILHPWVDRHNNVVGCDELQNWSKTSSLVAIVQKCYTELQKGPVTTSSLSSISAPNTNNIAMHTQSTSQITASPKPLIYNPNVVPTQTQLPPSSLPPPTYTVASTLPPYHHNHNNNNHNHMQAVATIPIATMIKEVEKETKARRTEIPAVPQDFPQLDGLHIDRLRQLQADTVALEAHVKSHPSSIEFSKQKDDIMQTNVMIAKRNLAKVNNYNALKEEVLQLQTMLRMKNDNVNFYYSNGKAIYTDANGDQFSFPLERDPSGTGTGDWIQILSNRNGEVVLNYGQNTINDVFLSYSTGIFKYIISGNIYNFYKRTTSRNFDLYSNLAQMWSDNNNVLNRDFKMFSTYADLVSGNAPWQFCNYNDNYVGYPRDCAPNGPIHYIWTSFIPPPRDSRRQFNTDIWLQVTVLSNITSSTISRIPSTHPTSIPAKSP